MGRVLQHIRGRITGLFDAWHGSIHAKSHTNGYVYGILKCKFFDVTQRQSNIQNFVISHSFVVKKVSNQSQHSNAYNQTCMIIFQSFVFEGEQFFPGEAKVFGASLFGSCIHWTSRPRLCFITSGLQQFSLKWTSTQSSVISSESSKFCGSSYHWYETPWTHFVYFTWSSLVDCQGQNSF